MNTNLIHNILNVLGLLVGAVVTFDWTALGASPATAAAIAGAVLFAQNAIKLVLNVLRDGVAGLAKTQPPVQ